MPHRKRLQIDDISFTFILQAALSSFFSEVGANSTEPGPGPAHHHNPQYYLQSSSLAASLAPANTPATPPNFPEALLAFSKMSTAAGESGGSRSGSFGQQQLTLNTQSIRQYNIGNYTYFTPNCVCI